MTQLLKQTTPKARKEYDCMASEWVRECLPDLSGLSFTEKRAIVNARAKNYKIEVGETYLRQVVKYDGELISCTMIPEIHAICINHDLYQE